MHSSFPSDHDDDDGRDARWIAAGPGRRNRIGIAQAIGNYHRRRIDRQPSFDVIHHSRRLHLYGSAAAVGGPQTCRAAGRSRTDYTKPQRRGLGTFEQRGVLHRIAIYITKLRESAIGHLQFRSTMHPERIAELLRPFLVAGSGAGVQSSPEREQGPADAGRPAALSSAQLETISIYIDILFRRNGRVNLTAVRDPEEIVTRHFGESLFAARRLFSAPLADNQPPVNYQR